MTNKNEQRKEPELRFPEFSGEWEKFKLKDLTTKTGEKNKENFNYPIASINNKIGFSVSGEGNYSNTSADIKEYRKVKKGEFGYNPARVNVGSLGYQDKEEILIVSSLYVIFKINKKLNSLFLYTFLKSNKFNRLVKQNTEGSVREYLFYENFSNISLYIPSVSEQQKIGEFFSKLDRQIELEEKKLALLEEQKKGYMQKIFSQELRFKDENGEEYPEWRWTNIKNEIDLITDYVSNGSFESLRKNVSYSSNSDYAIVIRLQDANNDWKGPFVYTNKEGYEFLSKTKLYKNDLIMSNVGSVGVFYRIPELEKPMTLGPNSILLRSKKNNNTFLYYFLNSHELRKRVFEKSTPGVQPKINKTDLKSISFNLPSIDEQNIIANLFDCIEKSLVNIKNRKYKREILKKELLNRMFL